MPAVQCWQCGASIAVPAVQCSACSAVPVMHSLALSAGHVRYRWDCVTSGGDGEGGSRWGRYVWDGEGAEEAGWERGGREQRRRVGDGVGQKKQVVCRV